MVSYTIQERTSSFLDLANDNQHSYHGHGVEQAAMVMTREKWSKYIPIRVSRRRER